MLCSPDSTVQITAHQRLQVRIDDDRRGALVFTILRMNPTRNRQRHVQLSQRRGDAFFVFRMQERKQQRDRNRFNASTASTSSQAFAGRVHRVARSLRLMQRLAP